MSVIILTLYTILLVALIKIEFEKTYQQILNLSCRTDGLVYELEVIKKKQMMNAIFNFSKTQSLVMGKQKGNLFRLNSRSSEDETQNRPRVKKYK